MKNLLFVTVALFVSSCTKTEYSLELPSEIPVIPDSVPRLAGVYVYLTYLDTSSDYHHFDSLYYNSEGQIEQVTSDYYYGSMDFNIFTYNSAGEIASMVTSGTNPRDYTFYYDDGNRLNRLVSQSNGGDAQTNISYTFSYDGQNHVQHVQSVYLGPKYEGQQMTDAVYYRNNSGGMDSIFTRSYYSENNVDVTGDFTGGAILSPNAIDHSYLFLMGLQYSKTLFNDRMNLYWHQYLNPDVSLLKTISYGEGKIVASAMMNPDQTVRWLTVYQTTDGSSFRPLAMNKFVYRKIPKE